MYPMSIHSAERWVNLGLQADLWHWRTLFLLGNICCNYTLFCLYTVSLIIFCAGK